MKRIISSKRSIVVATDVPTRTALEELVRAVSCVEGIGAIKLGFLNAMEGLEASVDIVKRILGQDFPVIYDHQKAGTDIPDTGAEFAKKLKLAKVDAAILFPLAGPKTQEAWTKACFDAGLQVMTGGIMTHAKFLVSEGGYIADDSVEKIYRNACTWGCRHFVVPGTKLHWVARIRRWLIEELGEGNFVLYAPGFITQEGNISECALAAGSEWHAIVGRGIYEKPSLMEKRKAAFVVTEQITGMPA